MRAFEWDSLSRSENFHAPDTIVDRLESAAADTGGSVLFHVEGDQIRLTAPECYGMACVRAARLRAAGIGRGDRVGIIGPNAPDWVAWGHATWMRGASLVPLPVPLRIRDPDTFAARISAIAAGFGCDRIAAHERFSPFVADELLIRWTDAGSLVGLRADELERLDDDSIALISPTSGSTSAPKGVIKSYRHINRRSLQAELNQGARDVIRYLTYAPLAHAAGMVALYAVVEPWLELHLLSPERFAREPGDLFGLVGPHRITTLAGASSALTAALRSIENRPGGADLTSLESLRLSFEMADPVLVDRLTEVGPRFGLRPEAIAVRYGLSEGGGTQTPPANRPRIDEVDLDALATHGIARPATGAHIKRVVSCGRPTQFELRIAGPDAEVAERHVGEVQFRGLMLMNGYIGPGAEDAFVDDGWMRTGDVGYVADGELYLTGRTKDVVVQQGKKYHPEDIERAAALGAGVGIDGCFAFASVDSGDGGVVTVIETDAINGLEALEQRVRAGVMNAVGVSLTAIVFVAPGTLPKTSVGKPQRAAVRARYTNGEFVRRAGIDGRR